MTLTMSIPALLFPAISLTMLAYNARYLAIAALVRKLYKEYLNSKDRNTEVQIEILSKRLVLIRATQASAIMSFIGSVFTMLLLFFDLNMAANIVFFASLSSMMISLILLLIEIHVSTKALQVLLEDIKVKV